MTLIEKWPGRHPATLQLLRWLEPNPRSPEYRIAGVVAAAADQLLGRLDDGPELSTGLRRLVEAKDCFVRQSLTDLEARPPADVPPP